MGGCCFFFFFKKKNFYENKPSIKNKTNVNWNHLWSFKSTYINTRCGPTGKPLRQPRLSTTCHSQDYKRSWLKTSMRTTDFHFRRRRGSPKHTTAILNTYITEHHVLHTFKWRLYKCPTIEQFCRFLETIAVWHSDLKHCGVRDLREKNTFMLIFVFSELTNN